MSNDHQEETLVEDEAGEDETVPAERYDISSFGADYDVEGLVRRLNKGDILIPPFQRQYVWKIKDASRFIESLLLGLPVPGVFLATEPETNKLLVIDGQQRLRTLQFFYGGFFKPELDEKASRNFRLEGVQRHLEGLTYGKLPEPYRLKLDNSILHATVIKQESPPDDDTSIYHVFERLNSGGRKLMPQEIRSALYHGPLIQTLRELNEFEGWRNIFGRKSDRQKDEELILRFLALRFDAASYRKPMGEFLNIYANRHARPSEELIKVWRASFLEAVDLIGRVVGRGAFKPARAINAAVFDSVMVGLSRRLEAGSIANKQNVQDAYLALLANRDYSNVTSRATSDETSVGRRLQLATEAFAVVK